MLLEVTCKILTPTVHQQHLTSIMLVAWLVLPLASGVAKQSVFLPNGRLLINGEMLTSLTFLPSSDRIFTAVEEQTQNSLPSPGIF